MNLGICSPFIGVNPSSTEEDPLYKVLPSSLPEKLKMAMKEFDAFPNGVIAVPPDYEPFIAKRKEPYKPKKYPENTDETRSFYAEDLLYGTVLAEVKKLDTQAFLMKGYMSSTFIKNLRDLANTEAEGTDLPEELTPTENLLKIDLKPLDEYIAKKKIGEAVKTIKHFDKFIKTHELEPDVRSKFQFLRDMDNGIKDAEVDTLIVLPTRKLIIVIETKAAREDTSFPSKLKDGSKQCEKFHQFLKAAHWNILSEQWKLVKCVSFPLIDLEEDKNQRKIEENCGCCVFCKAYIIDKRKVWISGLKTMLNSKL